MRGTHHSSAWKEAVHRLSFTLRRPFQADLGDHLSSRKASLTL